MSEPERIGDTQAGESSHADKHAAETVDNVELQARIRRRAPLRLIVEEGPHRGVVFELTRERTRLGRGDECEIQLMDSEVSRCHAEVRREGGRYLLKDLGSRNGVKLNGVQSETSRLEPGDRIAIGTVRLLVLPSRAEGLRGSREPGALGAAQVQQPPRPILGESEPAQKLLVRISELAASSDPVVVRGERGVGKELVARTLHHVGPRRGEVFVSLNCARHDEDELALQIFGKAGPSRTPRVGLVELAAGGTLYLSSADRMPGTLKESLAELVRSGRWDRGHATLRLLARVVLAVTHGEDEERPTDAPELQRAMELRVPTLRDRRSDIPSLAEAFLDRFARVPQTFSPEAVAVLTGYAWPGNVRELKNVVEAATLRCSGSSIGPEHLPPWLMSGDDQRGPLSLREAEQRAILDALAHFGGHRTNTARALGIDRKTLYTKLKEYGID